MSPKPLPTDLPIHSFSNASELEQFYERNHTTLPGFHLKFAKKHSGIPSVSGAEAVETALCFGWIDGRANGIDDKHWLVRYTPRRSKSSIWSQKNVDTVARLNAAGKMRAAGLKAVEAAKMDGRWARAYAGPSSMVAADDFTSALHGVPAAKAFWDGLNRSERYAVLWRVETASANARAGRIEALVQMLAAGQKPGAVVKSEKGVKSSKANVGVRRSTASKRKAVKLETESVPIKKSSKVDNTVSQSGSSRRPGLRSRQ